MLILAHRGMFQSKEDQNSISALKRAFHNGYGIETDVWASTIGALISHDVCYTDDTDMLNSLFDSTIGEPHIALNIKSSGLHKPGQLELPPNPNIFLFDGSIPDSLQLIKAGYKVFTRQSEYEKSPAFYELAAGVWLDQWKSDWVTFDIIQQHLRAGKRVAIVSPELHGRDHSTFWAYLKMISPESLKDVMLVTDYPAQAHEYLNTEWPQV